jgi:hypothetical protein
MGLSDFLAWSNDPMHFQSVGGERRRAIARGQLDPDQEVAERISLESTRDSAGLIPIPLRDRVTVYIANLPADLGREEAERISRVIRAYARNDDESGRSES